MSAQKLRNVRIVCPFCGAIGPETWEAGFPFAGAKALSKLWNRRTAPSYGPDLAELAARLEAHNAWRRGQAPYDAPGTPPPVGTAQLGEDIARAAAILRKIAEGEA